MAKPLLVVVGYVWPEPNSSAAGSRMLGILREFLARGWEVIFASAAALSPHRFDLNLIGIEEKIIQLNDSSFNDWVASVKPQVVMFDRFFTEEQFGWRVASAYPSAIRVLDTEDLHSLRAARQALLKSSATGEPVDTALEIAYAEMANMEMAQREVAAIFRSDLTLMISSAEMELLTSFYQVPKHLLVYLPLGINSPTDSLPSCSFAERQHLVVIGNFRHEPNWDSVVYLKQILWPLIRKKLKAANEFECELHIYGAYPPPKATQLHQPKDKFLVKGWADDAYAVLSKARLCLAPLRFGAGQKGKLLDAMLAGTPSVTTPVGMESMCTSEPDWPGAIAATSETLSEAVVALYTQEARWRETVEKIPNLIEAQFILPQFFADFFNALEPLISGVYEQRAKNPIGLILRSQQCKSTEYMGQWIEAKTKLAQLKKSLDEN